MRNFKLLETKLKYSVAKIIGLFSAWWILWIFVQSLILHRLQLDWKTAVIDSVISSLVLAFYCFILIVIFNFYRPGKGNQFYRFLFSFGAATLYAISIKWLLKLIISNPAEYSVFVENSLPVRFIISLLVLLFISVIAWLWHTIQEQKEQELRRSSVEQLGKEAELARLRQQLQPHFLFNSLNSINALIGSKPNDARKMIHQLSDFLRGTLKKDEDKIVLVREEIEHLKLYLAIEEVRFGHRLVVQINFSEEALNAKIPPLLLQPIVENAIKFGLYGTVDSIVIKIDGRIKDHYLQVTVQNPFDIETQNINHGTGFGLSFIQRRLYLLYARNDLMQIEQSEKQFTSILKIPQTL